jgi:2-hydroxymuconate-semialdehyde hydrolase/2-hydroxy-6-oxo-octa-2,4-dienoate hydrolase
MIEQGHGPALVLVPGLPGPWTYVAPAVRALSTHFRVLTMSLGPECTIESDVARIVAALDERRIDRAIVCGISFGGLIALRFAADHPDRVSALVLASAPGPGFTLRPRHRFYARWPWIFGPLFLLETPFHLRHDLRLSLVRAVATAPTSFATIARRALLLESTDIAADCRRVSAPTLVVTGEARFDHVVPVESTRQYLHAIPGSQQVVIPGTGHLGSITRADEFTRLVSDFVERPFQGRGRGPERPALRTGAA